MLNFLFFYILNPNFDLIKLYTAQEELNIETMEYRLSYRATQRLSETKLSSR